MSGSRAIIVSSWQAVASDALVSRCGRAGGASLVGTSDGGNKITSHSLLSCHETTNQNGALHCQVCWLAAWLPACLPAWLRGCLAAWLPGWLPACLPDCLLAWLAGGLGAQGPRDQGTKGPRDQGPRDQRHVRNHAPNDHRFLSRFLNFRVGHPVHQRFSY